MKVIVVEQNFRLPRVSLEAFRSLLEEISYDNGFWKIKDGNELRAYHKLQEHFTDFIVYKKCPVCSEYYTVNDFWSITEIVYKAHVDAHNRIVNEERQIFKDIDIRLGERSKRTCLFCGGALKGKYLTICSAVMECKICGEERMLTIGDDKVSNIKLNILWSRIGKAIDAFTPPTIETESLYGMGGRK
jgi:hypothetical protein